MGEVLNQSEIDFSEADMQSLMQTFTDEQGSDRWFEDRLGKVTASQVKWVVIRDRYGKPYKGYYDYLIELAIERVTGKAKRFSNRYVEHGKEFEPVIRDMYERARDVTVQVPAFIQHPTMASGASPDGLVDEDGTIEIKSPNTDTLVRYMVSMLDVDHADYELVSMLGLRGNEWAEYYDQMQWQLYITNRKWCDFIVGDTDMVDNSQLIIKRVERDDVYINEVMVPRVIDFLKKVDKLERYLRDFKLESVPEDIE